jgi:hypothetical protein
MPMKRSLLADFNRPAMYHAMSHGGVRPSKRMNQNPSELKQVSPEDLKRK